MRSFPIKRFIAFGVLLAALAPIGPAWAATPTCRGETATIWGTRGDDVLVGTSGDDVIVGKGGNDQISGKGGDDLICAGSGDDTVSGGSGDDRIYGGSGADSIDGGSGSDQLNGGRDEDRLRGGTGPDVIIGKPGRDDIVESNRTDVLPEADPEDRFLYAKLTLEPKSGTTGFAGYVYSGPIEVRSAADGLIVVEHVAPETYLLGIDEMPFSWDTAALKAQAIAARTYLANLVAFPRWGLMAKYGFDICDSTSCQVYEGIGVIDRTAGDRWQHAVEATAGKILLYNDNPAAALYHASAGSATRSIQDVWGGSAVPYLQAVPIENEGSVYSSWKFKIPLDAFVAILAEADTTFAHPVVKVRTTVTATGGGPYTYRVTTTAGTVVLASDGVRSALNTYGHAEVPDLLPAEYAPGKKYPSVIMSPTYTIRTNANGKIVIRGEGYGHQLGMSQYGAWAMAKTGSKASQILQHFYSGLKPSADPGFLPDMLEVGIGWQWKSVTLIPEAGYTLRGADGVVAKGTGGSLLMHPSGTEVLLDQ